MINEQSFGCPRRILIRLVSINWIFLIILCHLKICTSLNCFSKWYSVA